MAKEPREGSRGFPQNMMVNSASPVGLQGADLGCEATVRARQRIRTEGLELRKLSARGLRSQPRSLLLGVSLLVGALASLRES